MARVKGSAALKEELPSVTIDTALQAKIQLARTEINQHLIERRDEVDLVLLGMLSGKNVMLVGEPGIAKSRMAELLTLAIHGKAFNGQFNKFSQPEEVFGPLDLPSLTGQGGNNKSRYLRVVDERLLVHVPTYNSANTIAEADICILDELGKASTAIRNVLLRALNEKIFINDGRAYRIPLLFALATSNEWIGESDDAKEMAALFDRFALRKTVKRISSPGGRDRLLFDDLLDEPTFTVGLTPSDIKKAQQEACQIPWTTAAKDTIKAILSELQGAGISVGDRRQRWAVSIARASAYMAGDTRVLPAHLEPLQHVLWSEPIEQPAKAAAIIMKKANPAAAQITKMLGEAQEIVSNTNTKDITSCIASSKKLEEILDKLTVMVQSERRDIAMEFVSDNNKDLRKAAIDN